MPLRNCQYKQKLMMVILVTSGVVCLLTCISFITYEIITFRKSMVRGLTTRVEIIARIPRRRWLLTARNDATDVLSALKADARTMTACILIRAGRYLRDTRLTPAK